MLGVIASEAIIGGGGGLPLNAVGMLDFFNGTYLYGATSYTIAEVVTHPEFLITGGLQIGSGNVSPASAEILGPFAAYLIAGDWTIQIEFITPAFSNSQPFNLTGPSTSFLNLQDDNDLCDVVEFGDVFRYAENTGLGDAGVPRGVALTRNSAHTVISTDGSAIAEDTNPSSNFGDINKAWLGGQSPSSNDGDCLIGRLVIYPSQNNANMPSLSIPSVM